MSAGDAWYCDGRARWCVCEDGRAHFAIAAGPGTFDYLCDATAPAIRDYSMALADDVHHVPMCIVCVDRLGGVP